MLSKKLVAAALALTGALGAGAAQARGDVQWSVTIGAPWGGIVLSDPYPVYQAVPVVPAPVYSPYWYDSPRSYYSPRHSQRYGHRDQGRHRWDRDRDGIPDRFERGYGARWDRDGDGIPNRYDRVYNPRWDRDGDGIPNRYDRHPGYGHRR